MEEQKPTETTSCKGSVMSRIDGGEVCPRSKTFFQTRECAVWLLWAVSVVVGALAVAVTLFVLNYRQYGLYEATHDDFFTFMVEALPLLWIVVFGLMAFVGVYELRHTKRGYRYSLWQILLSSVVLSLAGGATLQFVGLGYTTDHMLGKQMSMYASQDKIERKMWQNPNDGRLLGRVTKPVEPPTVTATFEDVEGRTWQLDLSELEEEERELLLSEGQVKVIGLVSNENPELFHSCGAFPWLLDHHATRADFEATREAFEMKMHRFEEQVENKMGMEDGDEGYRRRLVEDEKNSDNDHCEEMEFMKKR
jgi:hypothetical protein